VEDAVGLGIVVAAMAKLEMIVNADEELCVATSRKCSNGIVTYNNHLCLPRMRLCETVKVLRMVD
jgi:hypothetical protein